MRVEISHEKKMVVLSSKANEVISDILECGFALEEIRTKSSALKLLEVLNSESSEEFCTECYFIRRNENDVEVREYSRDFCHVVVASEFIDCLKYLIDNDFFMAV